MEKNKRRHKKIYSISIIIPVGPGDVLNTGLIKLLDNIKTMHDVEIIIVSSDENKQFEYKTIYHKGTRGSAMNAGALESNGRFLLFLHCDSYMNPSAFNILKTRILTSNAILFYFDFKFHLGIPLYYKLTELGVWFRSRFLKIPFGDQGLTISRIDFKKVGGFNLKASHGEDIIFVKDCKKAGMKIAPVRGAIYTSPRKYKNNGWLKTTLNHQYIWYKQIFKYLKGDYTA